MSTTYWVLMMWYILGVCSFVYWYTEGFDLKVKDIAIVMVIGLIGPIVFIIGLIVRLGEKGNTVIIKARRKTQERV